MSRLVIAILILFAVLIGLRTTNSSLFQLSFANQTDSLAPATRNTGFSANSTGAASGSGVAQGFNAPGQVCTGTTALPPRVQPAVPAGW